MCHVSIVFHHSFSILLCPDNVILESSGVALPGSIASTLSLLTDFKIDGVVVLADVETVQQRAKDKFMADTVLRQLSDADVVLLNKTDLVSANKRSKTRDWLKTQAKGAQIIETNNSAISPAIVLQDFDWNAEQVDQITHHQALFKTCSLPMQDPVDEKLFTESLLNDYPGLIRAKGFIRSMDGELKTLQMVGRRVEISAAPAGVVEGLVVIQQNS